MKKYNWKIFFRDRTIERGIELLRSCTGGKEIKNFYELISDIYRSLEEKKKIKPSERISSIAPGFFDQDLFQRLLDNIGIDGLRKLMIFILDNDDRYNLKENVHNYVKHKPFPSYLIYFVYGILFFSDLKGLRNRKLFESFWEHQSRIRYGLDEQFAEKFLDPFIEDGITTIQEIRELCIKDWLRWQRAPEDSPYYGAPLGPSIWYFPGYSTWGNIVKKLEQKWREETGKEPKKWGE